MKHRAVISCLLLASCATFHGTGSIDIVSLKSLFRVCESDLGNARKVIVEHDLVKNLWHLQRMDKGGSKYYLLEREGITAMIKAVTEGVYDDFILVSSNGTVVYTMNDNSLFARSVRSVSGALAACHAERGPGPFVATVPPLHRDGSGPFLAVSSRVSGGNTMPGTFILLVDMEKVRKMVGERSCIIGQNGAYETACSGAETSTPYPDFDRIDLTGPSDGLAARRFTRSDGGSAEYRLFRYANLLWVFITE